MAIDFFAIASTGYFPTPTPTNTERMSWASTWGCFGDAPLVGGSPKGLGQLGMCLTTT